MSNDYMQQAKNTSLKDKAQFDAVLNTRCRVNTSYFVLHYCLNNLSTDLVPEGAIAVDNFCFEGSRLGLIIPKKWAKKSVSRSLIKRQCRAQFMVFLPDLPHGDWVIRLKRTFPKEQWKSCVSESLKVAVRNDLEQLFNKFLWHHKKHESFAH